MPLEMLDNLTVLLEFVWIVLLMLTVSTPVELTVKPTDVARIAVTNFLTVLFVVLPTVELQAHPPFPMPLVKPFAILTLKFVKLLVTATLSVVIREDLTLLLEVPIVRPMELAKIVPRLLTLVEVWTEEKLQDNLHVTLISSFASILSLVTLIMTATPLPTPEEVKTVNQTRNVSTALLPTLPPHARVPMVVKLPTNPTAIKHPDDVLMLVTPTPIVQEPKVLTAWPTEFALIVEMMQIVQLETLGMEIRVEKRSVLEIFVLQLVQATMLVPLLKTV